MTASGGAATTREQATARLVAKKARRRRARHVALTKHKAEAPSRDDAQLTFRSLDLCDGCGIRLEP